MDDEEAGAEDIQRKHPDSWAINWAKRPLFVLEYIRPNDRGADALSTTDIHKEARYAPLRDQLRWCLPGWVVEVQAYLMGVGGSRDLGRWKSD